MAINGFLIDIHTVSESNLEVQVDTSSIPWPEYQNLITELQDLLSDIDKKHSVKSKFVHERQLKAKYQRIAVDTRKKKLSFTPFPSKFVNLLKNTRAYIYYLIISNCIILEKIAARKVYLLPKELAPKMMDLIEETNKETIDKLNEDIKNFTLSDEYFTIKTCLGKYGISPNVLDQQSFIIGNFSIDVLPIDFGYRVDEDEFYKNMAQDEAKKGLQTLSKQIERKSKQYAFTATKETIRRLLEFAETADTGKRMYSIIEKLENLHGICKSLELKEIDEKIVQPLIEVFSKKASLRQETAEKLFGTWKLKQAVQQRINEITPFWR